MNSLYLITGGVKSGKSSLGLACVNALTATPLLLATGRHTDAEMTARIQRHQQDRPAHWQCVETPIDLPQALLTYDQPLLVDCLGTWLTNLIIEQPQNLHQAKALFLDNLSKRQQATVLISNESGLGVIGADAITRQFVDELGLLNQSIAERADHFAFCVSGQPMWLKGQAPF